MGMSWRGIFNICGSCTVLWQKIPEMSLGVLQSSSVVSAAAPITRGDVCVSSASLSLSMPQWEFLCGCMNQGVPNKPHLHQESAPSCHGFLPFCVCHNLPLWWLFLQQVPSVALTLFGTRNGALCVLPKRRVTPFHLLATLFLMPPRILLDPTLGKTQQLTGV